MRRDKQGKAKNRAKRYFVLLSGDSMCRHIWKGWPEEYETLDGWPEQLRRTNLKPDSK
jgi:hypothetical protein